MILDDIDVMYFLQVHDSDSVGTISPTDISVSCPLCREGRSWKRKHRLHLYVKPTYEIAAVHCWNCGYTSNIFGYLKEFHPSEFSQYSKAKRGQGFKELTMVLKEKKEDNNLDLSSVDIGLNMDKLETTKVSEKEVNLQGFADGDTPISKSDMSKIDIGFDMDFSIETPIKVADKNIPLLVKEVKNLIPIPKDAGDYIRNRGIKLQESWLYSPRNNKIRFNNTDILLSEFIIVPLTLDGKWYGFQALAWKKKQFFIYMVTGNSGFKVENWGSINKDKPVYIFESIYDRLSSGLENSIAALGANLSEDRIKELKQPIFCLDNFRVDDKAYEETLGYSLKGYKTFIWPKGSEKFKDTNDLRKINIPYEKISNMIKNNIYQGLPAQTRLKLV